ncbi:M48 family metalloprotease [Miltoncostaea marina]|uniref:M48 family metalloprotease n=1 Tax=Miltoncostaea marina TaxID=2843215 RepID=UPI001C3E2872|nr:M48 family metalloprotease [Miltoncostaea marina]
MRRRRRPTLRPAGGPARRAAGLAAVAAAGAGGVVALLRWRLWSAGVPDVDPAPLTDWFDPAELARNRDYRRGVWTMAAVGAPLGAATAVAAAATGRRWRPWVVRAAGGRPWRAGAIFGAGLAAATIVVALPLSAARYGWGREYGIVTQPVRGWLLDLAKGLGVQAVVAAVLGAGVAALVARVPRLWWAWVAAAAAGLVYAMSVASPLVLEPIFQRTEPLRDPALSAEVLELARRSGVEADDVKVNDASARTTAANAYVSGLGGSRHIVLYDTLLRDFPRDQVRMVVAHELAHVARRHVLKGSTWGAALAVPGCLLVFAVVGWRTGFGAPGRGPAGCDLVLRRVALAAATATVIGTLSAPLGNWVSRAYEREAEWGALAVTRDPGAAIGLQRGLVERSLGVPDPPRAVRVWFGSHPTALERIGMALRAGRG